MCSQHPKKVTKKDAWRCQHYLGDSEISHPGFCIYQNSCKPFLLRLCFPPQHYLLPTLLMIHLANTIFANTLLPTLPAALLPTPRAVHMLVIHRHCARLILKP